MSISSKIYNVFLIIALSFGCNRIYSQNGYKELSIDNDSLKIIYLIKEPIKINNEPAKYWTIKGKLKVENKRSNLTKYGNGFSNLIINDSLHARPYIDTYATILVDVDIIDLKPNSKIEFDVYWKFDSTILSTDKIEIRFRKPKLGLGDL